MANNAPECFEPSIVLSPTSSRIEADTSETKFTDGSEEQISNRLPYPKSIFFIIASNFAERFSYYGLKAILTLYFVEKLHFNPNSATITYHIFCSLCYFTPILGAIVSDARLGKFKTIIYFTVVYIVGGILLSGSAMPDRFWGPVGVKTVASFSLIFIAIGSGCIKPCLAAFGGDQFGPGQEKHIRTFFSVFYMSISFASLISIFITPLLKSKPCMGQKECYVMAFGVPALTLTLGLVVIAIGKTWYVHQPPGQSVIGNAMSLACYAMRKKCARSRTEREKESWLDYAGDKYEQAMIDDVKCLLKVFVLYIPLPLFYTLFDQQGSRWTLQATHLDGRITNEFYVQPDHMQMLNPLIVVLGVPFFDVIIYPICAKVHFLVKPLQRMVVGGFLAAIAFFVACVLQMSIEKANAIKTQPALGTGTAMLLNAAPCRLAIHSDVVHINFTAETFLTLHDLPPGVRQKVQVQPLDCPPEVQEAQFSLDVGIGEVRSIVFTIIDKELHYYQQQDTLRRSKNGQARVRVFFHMPHEVIQLNSSFTFVQTGINYYPTVKLWVSNLQINNVGSTDYKYLNPGTYKLYIGDSRYDVPFSEYLEFAPGGRYIVLLSPGKDGVLKAHRLTVTVSNRLSMFLQLPQYVLITFAEIMFAITGIEFSYSQAPPSMKSFVQAGWLMLIALGNVIMVIVTKTSPFQLSTESLAFASAMVIDMIAFSIMAYHYRDSDYALGAKPLHLQVIKPKEEPKNHHQEPAGYITLK